MPAQGSRLIKIQYSSDEVSSSCLYPCPAKAASAAQPEWKKYQSFRFQGSPGGPTAPGLVPVGKTLQNHVVVPGPEGTWIPLDSTPPGFPTEKSPPHNPTIVIVGATDRYFAFTLTPEGYRSLGLESTGAFVYVHDRRLNTWKQIASAATVPVGRRIFGSWLATIVEVFTPGGESPENPGRENERCCEQENQRRERGNEIVLRPYVRQIYPEVAAKGISIPGTLVLDNLQDGRRIVLDTGQEDSEILNVRDDGLVLHRVNYSIFAAHIEGDKLSEPTLVVQDEDVPEVHWVFWSLPRPQ
jgi:hypothetical protein